MLKDVGKKFGFNLNTPIEKMSEEQINVILYGTTSKSTIIMSQNQATAHGSILGGSRA